MAHFCGGTQPASEVALQLKRELEKVLIMHVEPIYPDAFLAGGELEGVEDIVPALCPLLSATNDSSYDDLLKQVNNNCQPRP